VKGLPAHLIGKKRDGGTWTAAEIDDLVQGITEEEVTDAQLGALLMAGLLRGLDAEETACFTRAMRDSGEVYDLRDIPGRKIDKHSTGGVGDKTSLVLAPLAASLGVVVPMVSGRGLGHTGGTVDKLESIPGMRMQLAPEEFRSLLGRLGVAMSSQTERLAPADRRMYAARDVTATVESIGWITSSILSKKLAEGIDALVLDVKCGRGAFMKDRQRARELARSLVATAQRLGCPARARITAMDEPLGRAAGNALEVLESVECLRGGGPDDLRECVLLLAADMLVLGGVAADEAAARRAAVAALSDGRALRRFRELVAAQGGEARVADEPEKWLPRAPHVATVEATSDGFVQSIDAHRVGVAVVELGGGRRVEGQRIDHRVGVVCRRQAGERVARGEPVLDVHARSAVEAAPVVAGLAAAVRVAGAPPAGQPLLIEAVNE
jgi:pyrimidine-nucleoside phosphorylase